MSNIAVIGAAGRMGKSLIEAIAATEGAQLSAALEHPDSSLIGADAGELAGIGRNNIQVAASLHDVADDFDVLIDFSIPAVTAANAAFCAEHGKRWSLALQGSTIRNCNRCRRPVKTMRSVWRRTMLLG